MSIDVDKGPDEIALTAQTQDLVSAFLAVLAHKQSDAAAALGAFIALSAYTINNRWDTVEEAEREAIEYSEELQRVVSGMHASHQAMSMGRAEGTA